MPSLNKKMPIIIIVLILVMAAIIYAMTRTTSSSKTNEQNAQSSNPANTKPTIATEWQWQEADSSQIEIATDSGTLLPFTAESVYNALQAVKLDADGNIILDHDALISLDETLERIHNRLDSESLSILQDLIKKALPGKAGEQTAQIVGDYYNFLEAKEEFSQLDEALTDTNREETLESAENDEALYAELQSLREVHMGNEATNTLFRISDANAKYMFDSMKLERDSSLTPAEKENRRKEFEAQHLEQSINIFDWPARYRAFMNTKQDIVAASIDDDEKRKQLRELLRQHFDSEEIKRIEYLRLDEI